MPLEGIWQYLETFFDCHNKSGWGWAGREGATGIHWVEAARDAGKHPTMLRAASTAKTYPVQDVGSALLENSGPKGKNNEVVIEEQNQYYVERQKKKKGGGR